MTRKLKPNTEKIIEAILYLITRSDQKKRVVTQYDIVKAFWLADTWHLEKYGRPVTFDNYVAMQNGPVASTTYDILKSNDYDQVLWRSAPYQGKARIYYHPHRVFNERKLSKSEINELGEAQDLVWALGFGGTRDMTHEHPAYKNAWVEGHPHKKAFPMDYSLLVAGDTDLLDDIIFASSHQ